MYSIQDGGVGGEYPPTEWIAQGTMPKVPMNANMVLPTGDVLQRTFPAPSPAGEAVVASLGEFGAEAPVNWAQWGQDMLTQGIQDTKGIIGSLVAGSGRQSVKEGFDATWQQQLAQQQMQMQLAAQQQKMQLEAQAMQQKLALQKAQMEAAARAHPEVPAQPMPSGMVPMIGPGMPEVEKKKLPTWAWVAIGLGGVAVVGGAIYFFVGRGK